MVFRFLGQIVRRGYALVLLAWAAVLGAAWLAAPPWDEVAIDRVFAFLPADVPSRQAEEIFKTAFPESQRSSNIVLVLSRNDTAHVEQDREFIKDALYPALRQIAESDGGLANEPRPSDD